GPIIVLAGDGIAERLALGVAADAGVVGRDIVLARGVDHVDLGGMGGVRAARPVAGFAADVPLGHGLGLDVVVHRVAAIAQGAGRAPGIVAFRVGIELRPPVA